METKRNGLGALRATLFASLVLSYSSAYAQSADNEESATAQAGEDALLEEIVVTGIRGSLNQSLNIKRESAEFMDVISAEDIGKLPDQNVAEALQRVPGVAIQRSRGEGDFVSMRGLGPEFVRGTLNGRTLVSGTETQTFTRSGNVETSNGRETNFDLLPSELISILEVVKSPAAEHVEGGMGGVVNVKTRRPLDLGQRGAATVSGVYREFNQEFDPSLSALYSWTNADKDLGLLMSVAHSQRSIREDNSDSWGYAPLAWTGLSGLDSNADGSADLSAEDLFTASSSNPESYEDDRQRTTVAGTLQRRFQNDSELTLEMLYSQRDISSLGSVVAISPMGWTGGAPVFSAGLVNADGSLQIPELTVANGTATSYRFSSGFWIAGDEQELEDNLFSVGANYGFSAKGWQHELDLVYSRAEGYLSFQRVGWGIKEDVPFLLDVSEGLIDLTVQSGATDLGDLSNYVLRGSDVIERFNDDDEIAFSLDSEKPISRGLVDAVKVGARVRTRGKVKDDRTATGITGGDLEAQAVGAFRRVGGWLDGDSGFPFDQVPFPEVRVVQNYVSSSLPDVSFVAYYSPVRSYDIDESTYALYAQLDLLGELGDIPFSGNLGVRVVQTDSDITGFFQPFRIENDESNVVTNQGKLVSLGEQITEDLYSSRYTNVLPSLNLRFDLSEDLLLRFAIGKSVTRPVFRDLSPGLNSINETNREASSGNPELRAYESLNFDVGLEWYFGEASVVYAAAFSKDIEEFIGTSTFLDPNHRNPGSDGDGDGIADGLGSSIVRAGVGFGSVTQPSNQGKAEITGVEAGYQHSYDNGFGYLANATYIDSSAEFTSGVNEGEKIPFEGVSDLSYNITGYFERGAFQARLAYSFRDDFVLIAGDVLGNNLFVDGYRQLDASLSYSRGEYAVFLNIVNLTDEETLIYSDVEERPVSYSLVGRRVQLGVRATF